MIATQGEEVKKRVREFFNKGHKTGNKMYHGFGGMQGYIKLNEKGEPVPNIALNDHEIDALVAYLQSLK